MSGGWFDWRRRRDTQRWRQSEAPVQQNTLYAAEGKLIRLRQKTMDDAPVDYEWRKDPELASFDAVPPISVPFDVFLRDYRYELASIGPRRRRYAIENLHGQHIGNCSLFNVDDRRRHCELGIMIGVREYWSKGYGEDTVRTLLTHAFTDLPVDRVYLYTLDWNVRAQKSFRKAGFKEYTRVSDEKNQFVVMEIFREEYLGPRQQATWHDGL